MVTPNQQDYKQDLTHSSVQLHHIVCSVYMCVCVHMCVHACVRVCVCKLGPLKHRHTNALQYCESRIYRASFEQKRYCSMPSL